MTKLRFFVVALITSLALNLFLSGILVGIFIHKPPLPLPPSLHGPGLRLMNVLQALPEASRQKIQPTVKKYTPQFEAHMDAMWQLNRHVHAQLTADNLDAKALAGALNEVRQAMSANQSVLHNALVEIAQQLNEEERRMLLEGILKRP